MKKKILSALFLVGTLVAPFAAHAEGGIIGTDAKGLADGVTNVYYQHKLNDTAGVQVGFATASGVSLFSGYYKGYFGGDYANAGFFRGGAIIGNGSVVFASFGVGYEATLGGNFVVNASYNAATVISGGSGNASGIAIEIGYKL